MNIETILADDKTSNIIRNLYPLYLYDLSEFNGTLPNEYGIYEDEPVKTLEEQYHVQDLWFQEPGLLYPFIIFKDKLPVGFALVSTGKYSPKTTDYYLYEFFLLRPYRGENIAEIAAKQVFDKFKGKWELFTHPTPSNIRAQSFWQKTINHYTSGNFTRENGPTFDGEKIIFRFSNNID
ncbi:GNAT family N-acetyltransferase [Mycoplasmatota bacterium]|nr:GNAT family N-acetyltransferase [Mycoplasmatota bacterium]